MPAIVGWYSKLAEVVHCKHHIFDWISITLTCTLCGLWSFDMCINGANLFYGIAMYLFITLTSFKEMLQFMTLPNQTKRGLIDSKWQTPVKFILLFRTNLIISRPVLDNIPCWFLKEFAIYSASIVSQWPTDKFCTLLAKFLHVWVWFHPSNTCLRFVSQFQLWTYTHYKYPNGFYSLKPTQDYLIKAHHSFVFCVHWK